MLGWTRVGGLTRWASRRMSWINGGSSTTSRWCLHQRQAGAASEGVVRQTAVATIERLAVDTHGYPDFGMAIAKLLGCDVCPRLRH
jgi:hypothetical protein